MTRLDAMNYLIGIGWERDGAIAIIDDIGQDELWSMTESDLWEISVRELRRQIRSNA